MRSLNGKGVFGAFVEVESGTDEPCVFSKTVRIHQCNVALRVVIPGVGHRVSVTGLDVPILVEFIPVGLVVGSPCSVCQFDGG